VFAMAYSTESRLERQHSGSRCLGPRILGSGFGDRKSGLRKSPLHSRPERVDELQHEVGELAGTVGGGQAFDQLQSPVAALELEELLTVDRRPHVERSQRLLACGRVQDDENARYAVAARMSDGERPIDRDGRARVRRGRLPRSRPDPRIRTARGAVKREKAVGGEPRNEPTPTPPAPAGAALRTPRAAAKGAALWSRAGRRHTAREPTRLRK
jgi:hypothetical protein